jgi:hypothetical protein
MTPMNDAKAMFGFWGFILGAGVAMTIGFAWGGWVTSGTAQKMSEEAVQASRAEICVAQFMGAPDHTVKFKQFHELDSYRRYTFIEEGGWDRMPGQTAATWGVSNACVSGLEALIKTGG